MAGKKGMKHYPVATKLEAVLLYQEEGKSYKEITEFLEIASRRALATLAPGASAGVTLPQSGGKPTVRTIPFGHKLRFPHSKKAQFPGTVRDLLGKSDRCVTGALYN